MEANRRAPAPERTALHDSPPRGVSSGYTAEEEADYLAEVDAALAVRDALPETEDFGSYFKFVEPLSDAQRRRALDDSEPLTLWDGSEAWRSKVCDDA